MEERGDFLLVGLQLLPGFPDRGVLVGRVLQFDDAQRQPVDEDHDVGPAVVLALDDRELVDRQPVVVGRVVVVDELHPVPGNRAVLAAILDLDAIPQHPVEGPVGPDERWRADAEDFAEGLLAGLAGNVGVDPVDGRAKSADKHHVAERLPLGGRFAGGDVRAVADPVSQFLEPGQGGFFDGRFVESGVGMGNSQVNKS